MFYRTRPLTKYKAYNLEESALTLPQKLMVSLQLELFLQDPWKLLILYLDAEGKKCLTGYRLAELLFHQQEDMIDIESPSCGICESCVFSPRSVPICFDIYLFVLLIDI